jgi:hypothetical protein
MMIGSSRFLALKARMAMVLKRYPALFRLASRTLYEVDRSFDTLSPGAPAALEQAFAEAVRTGAARAGDYYEFGLFRGFTLWSAQRACRAHRIAGMRFWGFDSFAGLPEVAGIDRTHDQFFAGQFACSKAQVLRNLAEHGADLHSIELIEGFFDRSLTPDLKAVHSFRPVAIAFIDCDLYTSTRDVLAWLEGYLRPGSILLFDDWTSFGDDPSLGQPRAFHELLAANPRFTAEPLLEFEAHGKGFTLRSRS